MESFKTWKDVLDHVGKGQSIRYKAPMDLRAQCVTVKKVYKNGSIRIQPWSNDCDAFTADASHLDRIRRFA